MPKLIYITLIIAPVQTSVVTTSVPDVPGNNTPIIIIIVVVVVALLIIVIILALISICAIWRKHHRDELKLENSKRYEESLMKWHNYIITVFY